MLTSDWIGHFGMRMACPGRLNDVWDQLFPVERHRIANLMIERIDLVHVGEVQGIKVKWRELG
jgi:site-specific DNA recombinase